MDTGERWSSLLRKQECERNKAIIKGVASTCLGMKS